MIHTARLSRTRHEFVNYTVVDANSKSEGGADLFSVAEAAAVLGWDIRRTRRLAQRLFRTRQAKRIGSSWAVDRAPVLALAERNKL